MPQSQSRVSRDVQQERKRLLIEATLSTIHDHGLSNLTLAKVATQAGSTAGTVAFHFTSKEALLTATLRYVAEEFAAEMAAISRDGDADPAAQLLAIVDANLGERLCDRRKIAVWYAFMSEARSRSEYLQICGDRDAAYFTLLQTLFARLAENNANTRDVDPDALARGFSGLLEEIWQDILFSAGDVDRDQAIRRCRAYLASVLPDVFDMPVADDTPPATADDGPLPTDRHALVYSLPSWTYSSDEFFALEKERLFMPGWQLVCHTSDLPDIGAYVRFDLYNERAFVVRDEGNRIRAFHNVCSHRAHSIVQAQQGRCPGRFTCPYHGWTFALDGRRIGIAAPETFRRHGAGEFGLKNLDVEVFLGFVFIRFAPGGPAVAECFAPVRDEFAAYQPQRMIPASDPGYAGDDPFWMELINVDWKNGLENYVEDYHFPIGHKGLSALMDPEYEREALANGVCRLSHRIRKRPLKNWSVERYHGLLPAYRHLPESQRRRWTYYVLFPNTCFDIFPEQMDFMQMLPVAPGKMLLRGRSYYLPEYSGRIDGAVRYLGNRINRRVQDEDNRLTQEVQQGLGSSGYAYGILSDKENLVKHFQDWIRERVPA